MVESGSDLDFIRPGISIFGAPPSKYESCTIKDKANQVKKRNIISL